MEKVKILFFTILFFTSFVIYAQQNNGSTIYFKNQIPKQEAKPFQATTKKPLFILDGKESTQIAISELKPENIESINVLKDSSAVTLYGDKGKDGVILITSKKPASKAPTEQK
ncbi:TonB-dependent receptor plug domain-containing protein [Flavobacterium silvaticum]|uniref:TonB-dependent receptor plug domain-containing protein n=1 Tax=Flavobacterium silvaticum TaxID=1852020 RepID=A0A972FP91_9FLAO|nr:TonB-dependent receptor plug domain-containing protein [Flavobacterium silvaticum]NMH29312.1 TonB-dependent receptor plug domain-containing protein [Flavobacterium silvaticum]